MLLTTVAVPLDYEDLLSQYTHRGYRVIACAAKYEQKLSWMKVQKMTRADAECDLEFIGFIIFENKLKPETTDVITELNRAGIRNIMCTGDNILTAVSVARECGLISPDEPCFIPHFAEGWSPASIDFGYSNFRDKQAITMTRELVSPGKMSTIQHINLMEKRLWYVSWSSLKFIY